MPIYDLEYQDEDGILTSWIELQTDSDITIDSQMTVIDYLEQNNYFKDYDSDIEENEFYIEVYKTHDLDNIILSIMY